MPNKIDAIKVEKSTKLVAGHYRVYYFYKCSDCDCELKIREDQVEKHSGKCSKCSHRKLPFMSLYNRLYNGWRKIPVILTYEEYLEFTKIPNCHYCGQPLLWNSYATIGGKFISCAYFLDRKDNGGPYSKENCVACCSDCNHIRGNHFTYEEFVAVGKILAKRYNGS